MHYSATWYFNPNAGLLLSECVPTRLVNQSSQRTLVGVLLLVEIVDKDCIFHEDLQPPLVLAITAIPFVIL